MYRRPSDPRLRGELCPFPISGDPFLIRVISGKVLLFPITRDDGDLGDSGDRRALRATPPGLFPLLLQTKACAPINAWASLAWPLGDAWATLGPPKRHPIPDPIAIGRGSQSLTAVLLWLSAVGWLLTARFSKTSSAQAGPRSEDDSVLYHLFAYVSKKNWAF
jgi:hypothetical protein